MIYRNGLGSEDLNTFSICLRFNVKFLRPEYSHIFSYSSFIHDNTLQSSITLQSDSKLYLRFCKYYGLRGITPICSENEFKSVKIHEQWHHVCWLVDTEGIDSNEISVSTKLFFDGKEVDQGKATYFSYVECSILISLLLYRHIFSKRKYVPSDIHKWIFRAWSRF